jgi:hypothetical protein
MSRLFRFSSALTRHPEVEAWLAGDDPMRAVARPWFEAMRGLGPDIRELLHDGHPTACVEDAAFAYVDAFSAHASIGFYEGAALPDPAGREAALGIACERGGAARSDRRGLCRHARAGRRGGIVARRR